MQQHKVRSSDYRVLGFEKNATYGLIDCNGYVEGET